jgi:hypothetical protein
VRVSKRFDPTAIGAHPEHIRIVWVIQQRIDDVGRERSRIGGVVRVHVPGGRAALAPIVAVQARCGSQPEQPVVIPEHRVQEAIDLTDP